MLAFIGDIHGNLKLLKAVLTEIQQYPEITAVVQVGDFGFYPQVIREMKLDLQIPIYAIDGNHEDFHLLAPYKEVTEVRPNLFYVPRGTVMELDGRTLAFCGGAASVDKAYRLRYGMSWHEEENITDADVMKTFTNTAGKKIDIFVTHCPPQFIIQRHFDPENLVRYFGLPITWTDPSADKIEELWNQMGQPLLISGHMHRTVVDGNVRILNIGELFCL